ncbi:MAG: twin-arginine translocase TatA/TatE family subunit [Rickettsiales bacterium]
MGLGITELLLILVIVLVLFGASKLTKTMGDLGKGVRTFKDGLKEEETEKKE